MSALDVAVVGTRIRAARTVAAEQVELVEVERPALSEGRALVRIEYATLCGTDLHIWEDDYPTDLPIVQGHELSGVVVEVEDRSGRLSPGARVAIDPLVNCGRCELCLSGRHNICPNMTVLGCYEDGGLTEVLSVAIDKLSVVPDSLGLDIAAMAEPASIAMQAVTRGTPVSGEVALVLGSGPIGLFATMCLTECGVFTITSDTVPSRLEFAREFGADATLLIDPAAPFPTQQLRDLLPDSSPLGPQLVIEATGVPASLVNAIGVAAPGGRIVQVGISSQLAGVRIKDLTDKELDVRGSRNSVGLIPDCLEMLERHPDAAQSLLTHRFDLEHLGAAFHTMRDRTQRVGKILIAVGASGVSS